MQNDFQYFFRKRTLQSCPPDCPDRSATCHATCEKYLAAWKRNQEERSEIVRKGKLNDEIAQYKQSLYTKIGRKMMQDKRK